MIEHPAAHPFTWTPAPCGTVLELPILSRTAAHFFTTRELPLRGASEENGWARLANAVGVGADRLVRLKQVHGVDVIVVRKGERDSNQGRPRADVVMTNDPAIAVAVQVADCVPLLLADPVNHAVAAVHGGWRGAAAGVARVAVSAMTANFGTRPSDLLAAVGPSIGACCYQVGQDVADAFRAGGFPEESLRAWFRPDRARGRYRLDVPRAIVDQLRDAGLQSSNIAACGLCTACHPSLFPSYRREGAGTGRIAGIIRPESTT